MNDATAPRLDAAPEASAAPTADAMQAFFAQHPQFLAETLALNTPQALAEFVTAALRAQPEWLSQIDLPEPEGSVINLPHRLLRAWREKLAQQTAAVAYLHQTAELNAALDRKMHTFTCALLAAPQRDADTVCGLIRQNFAVDAVTLTAWNALNLAARQSLEGWKASQTPLCGRLTEAQRRALLGADFPETGSAAVVAATRSGDSLTILALGRFTPDGFTPAQGTLFVAQIGELVGAFLCPSDFAPTE